ncbi:MULTISPECIES: hypothetical protein [unclassified Sporosarcina]|uniref:hypothetical protein n=1 Tax=unclassified Sporosarcina TaxID=2647733 RepID=UPI000C16EC90|nr:MULTISPECIES: hypothetical protein [unclassified Sporosarcina]PID00519.1 hypothetical protein CSV68_03060 [Sporosarcina sp. P29]PID05809.1 hypothetical protein CSV66_08520 [Sporosarcina sp. P30]PID09003.1 hypothetical protein CSV65_08520 [Sporosarcina sp. P31]PID12089.1 hypothetical protein CSV64_09065 [Sporosarcina sp. P32b]
MNNYEVSKNSATNLSTKIFVALLAVLGLNTSRYGTYLLEGSTSLYYWIMFILNLLSVVYVLIFKLSKNETDSRRV